MHEQDEQELCGFEHEQDQRFEPPAVDDGQRALLRSTAPLCESPLCGFEASQDRRGIMLCERHATWIDIYFCPR